jgi:hypothetical protein
MRADDTITTFLRARLDEAARHLDELVVEARAGRRAVAWGAGGVDRTRALLDRDRIVVAVHAPRPTTDPARPVCAGCERSGRAARTWPCGVLREMAAAYAGHPDYDRAWALPRIPQQRTG